MIESTMMVTVDNKEEKRKILRYEVEQHFLAGPPLPIPFLHPKEEIFRTVDGKVIIIKV